jgi:prepilin-type N-terminal cleavage/methylation domain-containing protein
MNLPSGNLVGFCHASRRTAIAGGLGSDSRDHSARTSRLDKENVHVTRGRGTFGRRAGVQRRGFTLLEVVTALAVLAVAILISVSAYSTSVSISNMTRLNRAAAAMAEEQFEAIVSNPDAFDWSALAKAKAGDRAEISPVKGDWAIEAPSSTVIGDRAINRKKAMYDRFSCEAFGVVPESGGGYVELTVVIHWKNDGRDELFALTSFAPRPAAAEGAV